MPLIQNMFRNVVSVVGNIRTHYIYYHQHNVMDSEPLNIKILVLQLVGLFIYDTYTEISHPCIPELGICAPLRLKSLTQANFALCTAVYVYSPYSKYYTNHYIMYCYK
jgi:hypothetical protein